MECQCEPRQTSCAVQPCGDATPLVNTQPWTAPEWAGSDFFTYDYCIGWPKPHVAEPPFPGGAYPNIPTLVLNGDMDLRTDVYQARQVAANFPNSTYVEVPNNGHVTALYDADQCASVIVRRFMRTLDAGDTSCVDDISEHRVVRRFAETASQAPQAKVAGKADDSKVADRRAAYVAVESVSDVVDRWYAIPGYTGVGLYGGTLLDVLDVQQSVRVAGLDNQTARHQVDSRRRGERAGHDSACGWPRVDGSDR